MDTTYKGFELVCKPGCHFCCTFRVYGTSIEGYYILQTQKEALPRLSNFTEYPRPRMSHNQMLMCYIQGEEPVPEEFPEELKPCPFLDEKGLCSIYEARPLMCRLMASVVSCESGAAQLPPFLFKVSTIAFQIVENIDQGGVYGSIFDVLKLLQGYQEDENIEIPPYILSNLDIDELPILPEEKDLKNWVGRLYRTPVEGDKTFRDLLNELRTNFHEKYQTLSFLEEIF